MSSTRHQRLSELFLEAVELSPEERFSFLDQACGDDHELRRDVETLLSRDEGPGEARGGGPPADRPPNVANFRILELLGEGGMGLVYLAEQQEPIQRRVALKLIKWGMDTPAVVARFEIERQALALMNHPNVARVIDAGATEHGRPYFVMEYVPGIPVTAHCDKHRLSPTERLELFITICDGVQHAHQKGVIHRDLKPSNVLVSVQGARAIPKIIDFGVAKATSQRLTERSVFTELGQLIGTPEYMSPEQAEMDAQDVDTRTDVYSLGVLLYELLVGALPFDSKELRQAGFDEIRRRIREEQPSRPSTRASTLGEQSTESARRRRTQPRALARQLRGDLDWITMKALEKDRTRRYASASELAADIGRYLRHQPVIAGPPSASYRLGKFVRRHRLGVAASVAVGVAVVLGAVGTSVGLVQAKREAIRANREAEAKGQVSEFLKNLFEVSDPGEARGNSITARELLDKGAEQIDRRLVEQPQTRAELMATMGDVYRNLGLFPQAEPRIEQALEIRKRVLGDDHPDTLHSLSSLASLYWNQGRYAEAEPLWLEALETSKRVLGDDHPDTLRSMNYLAVLYTDQGRYAEAEPLFLETLETSKRVLGDDHPDTLGSMSNLAWLYTRQGRHAEAEPLYLETFESARRVLGDDHPETLGSMNNLATLYSEQGRYTEAEALYLETLETGKRVLGDDHRETLTSMNNLALLYQRQGRYAEAEALYLETLETQKRVLGDDHPGTALTLYNLACFEAVRGDRASAMDRLRQAVDAGVANADWMLNDSDLESLHGDPAFGALVERARQNAAARRAGAGAD